MSWNPPGVDLFRRRVAVGLTPFHYKPAMLLGRLTATCRWKPKPFPHELLPIGHRFTGNFMAFSDQKFRQGRAGYKLKHRGDQQVPMRQRKPGIPVHALSSGFQQIA